MVISQRLIPSPSKGVVPAVEVMLANDAVRNLIREGKVHMIDNVINTSSQVGMVSLDRSIAYLVNNGLVEFQEAIKYTMRPEEFRRLIDSKMLR
ncbi:MAG: hypothetical protein KatS3mg101_0427 [Patescibacteria group bacterium]|nr:MAG: hypothetical protein KatS3mg101_0427 [Patescibacteria group bacterium]